MLLAECVLLRLPAHANTWQHPDHAPGRCQRAASRRVHLVSRYSFCTVLCFQHARSVWTQVCVLACSPMQERDVAGGALLQMAVVVVSSSRSCSLVLGN